MSQNIFIAILLLISITQAESLKFTDDLLAFYKFGNDASDGFNSNDAIKTDPVTSVQNRFGEENSAFHFQDTSTYIFFPESLLDGKTDFSIFFWFKLDNEFSNKFDTSMFHISFEGENQIYMNLDHTCFFDMNNSLNPVDKRCKNHSELGKLLKKNVWYHLGFTINNKGDGTSVAKYYLDGILQKEIDLDFVFMAKIGTNGFIFGQDVDKEASGVGGIGNPTDDRESFEGSASDIRIYGNLIDANTAFQIYLEEKNKCTLSQYVNMTSLNCENCNYNCLTCQTNFTQCLICQGNNREDESKQCVCEKGYFDKGSLKDCLQCESQCGECEDTADNCKVSCNGANRELSKNCGCADRYYGAGNCDSTCNHKCLSCVNSAENCLSCQGDNREDESKQCVCKKGFYDDGSNKDCLKCDDKCGECSGSSDQCITSCNGSNRDISKNCECSNGFFGAGDCDSTCDVKCLNCTGTSDNCGACKGANRDMTDCQCLPTYYQHVLQSDCEKCQVDNCLQCDPSDPTQCQKAEEGYFLDGFIPKQCNFGCKKCVNSADNCQECQLKTVSLRIQSQSCECPEGHFDDKINFECQACLPECKSCVNNTQCLEIKFCSKQCAKCENNKDNCTACSGLYRQTSPSCLCQQGYYDNGVDLNCLACKSNCLSCEETSENCTECTNPEMMAPACNQLKKGKFLSFSIQDVTQVEVIDCNIKCQKCSVQSDLCDVCVVGLNRSDISKQCECKEGFHDSDGSTPDCIQCKKQCKSCSNSSTCNTCQEGSFREFNNFSLQCGCMKGYNSFSGELQCKKCFYYLGECFQKCPNNSVYNEKENICEEIKIVLVNNMVIYIVCAVALIFIQIMSCVVVFKCIKLKEKQPNKSKQEQEQQQIQDQSQIVSDNRKVVEKLEIC